jgi:hypothetical protein
MHGIDISRKQINTIITVNSKCVHATRGNDHLLQSLLLSNSRPLSLSFYKTKVYQHQSISVPSEAIL